ncbi:hypothetical protein BCR42DRAFT_316404, partial [Absidia repens]
MYTKFLRSPSTNPCDILCLQDIHPTHETYLTDSTILTLERLFPNTTSIFTKYTAIIIFNPLYKIDNASITIDQRIITADIIDISTSTMVCSIASIYAPAQKSARPQFYQEMQTHPLLNDLSRQWILMGDFNIHYYRSPLPAYLHDWSVWLKSLFIDPVKAHNQTTSSVYRPQITYRQGKQGTTVDYIFCHPSLMPAIGNTTQRFLLPSFTDHAQLSFVLHIDKPYIGPGVWRFNNQLLQQDEFRELLLNTLDRFFAMETETKSKQSQWDTLKVTIKRLAIGYS